jgi:hypothetical protein
LRFHDSKNGWKSAKWYDTIVIVVDLVRNDTDDDEFDAVDDFFDGLNVLCHGISDRYHEI